MAPTTLELVHAGPVDYFEIDFSSGFGIYELHGTKGSGKTTVLKSADLLAGRKVDITVTDGELSGEVRGFGVIAPIGGKRRRKGELSVGTIENEKWSLTDLVDPPYKDAKARDRHRIQAILGLRGVIAEPADFFDLVGGKEALEGLIPPEKLATDDPMVLSSRIKDALETKAREEESTQEHEAGHAKACRENPENIDTSRPSVSSELQAAYDSAKERQLKLRQDAEAWTIDAKRRSEALASLEKAVAAYSGPTVSDASKSVSEALGAIQKSASTIIALEKTLSEARGQHKTLEAKDMAAKAAFSAAVSHQETCQAWRATIDAAPFVTPTKFDVEDSNQKLQSAKEDLEYGVKVRKLLDDAGRATRHQTASDEAGFRAEQLRERAASTMDVLTKLVECPGIKIESVEGHPRCIVQHAKRGKTLFDELSDGERVRYSIDATLIKLEGPALVSIPQRIFQDLPPTDRHEIHEFCRQRRIYGIGAVVTDGDLRVQYLGDGFQKSKGKA